MTIASMALVCAVIGESIVRLGRRILVPALIVGATSVAHWQSTGDLRLYVWVQFTPLLIVSAVLLLYRSRFSHRWLLPAALAFQVLAKVPEHFDRPIFGLLGGAVRGHTLEHLLAAAACHCLVAMVSHRRPSAERTVASGFRPDNSARLARGRRRATAAEARRDRAGARSRAGPRAPCRGIAERIPRLRHFPVDTIGLSGGLRCSMSSSTPIPCPGASSPARAAA